MTTVSDERLAFMRRLGITDEDVLEPSPAKTEVGKKGKLTESHLGGGSIRETSRDPALRTRPRAVFLNADIPESSVKSSPKGNNLPRMMNGEGSTSGLSAEQLKSNGNQAFEEGRYREALNCYTDAIEMLLESGNYQLREQGCLNTNTKSRGPIASGFSAGDPRIILLAALFSNRSACFLQASKQIGAAEALESAIRDADRAVELRPSWFKGYSRQGDAFFKMKKYAQAAETYEMALQLDPGNKNLLQSVREARQRHLTDARENVHTSRKQAARERTEGNAASDAIRPVAVPAPMNVSVNDTTTGRRDSGQYKVTARQLWRELKHEVEASVQQPTGDDYRREQLRLYREQKEREKNGYSPLHSEERHANEEPVLNEHPKGAGTTGSTGLESKILPRREHLETIPQEFSSDAAAAYQQRLLEEYRRKKARQV
ncbi:stress-induced protein sti1 [Trypanosoma grayi]|uniref:stress-induced protein sti1 n=1 Tax=Trypanosoma grayi TaxID=71804 RepID=UPI0004F455DE|nr:stress-induced protein sti1 [Trypanosoma grayi]KEG07519.1 stress-induced protein sti1 [Trypanosoma grayi]